MNKEEIERNLRFVLISLEMQYSNQDPGVSFERIFEKKSEFWNFIIKIANEQAGLMEYWKLEQYGKEAK